MYKQIMMRRDLKAIVRLNFSIIFVVGCELSFYKMPFFSVGNSLVWQYGKSLLSLILFFSILNGDLFMKARIVTMSNIDKFSKQCRYWRLKFKHNIRTSSVLATYSHSGLVQTEQFIDNGIKTILDRLNKLERTVQFVDALFSTGVTLPRVSLTLNLPTQESSSRDSASTSTSSNPFPTIQSIAPAISTTIIQQDSQMDGQIQSIEQYHLSLSVKTVIQLWEEYDQGLAKRSYLARGPSIRSLDEQFGRDWRKKDDCRKAYSRRRRIWEAVIRAAKNLHLSEKEVAERIEQWRSSQSKMSLTALNELLERSLKDRIDPVDSGVWGAKDVELRHVM